MGYRILADAVLLVHVGFVVFVLVGGFSVFRWPRLAWLHLPAAAWGALIELFNWICPLTPLENWLRFRAGEAVYHESFLENYLLPVIYPDRLTRSLQLVLGALVLLVNGAIYTWFLRTRRYPTRDPACSKPRLSSEEP